MEINKQTGIGYLLEHVSKDVVYHIVLAYTCNDILDATTLGDLPYFKFVFKKLCVSSQLIESIVIRACMNGSLDIIVFLMQYNFLTQYDFFAEENTAEECEICVGMCRSVKQGDYFPLSVHFHNNAALRTSLRFARINIIRFLASEGFNFNYNVADCFAEAVPKNLEIIQQTYDILKFESLSLENYVMLLERVISHKNMKAFGVLFNQQKKSWVP